MLGRISISTKLWAATLLLAIPAVWLAGRTTKAGDAALRTTMREGAAVKLVALTRQPLQKTGDFVALGALAGAEMFPEKFSQQLSSLRGEVRYHLTESLEARLKAGTVDPQLAEQAAMRKQLGKLNESWSAMARGDGTITSSDGLRPFTAFQAAMIETQRNVGESGGLVTDPEPDTSSLINSVLNEVPEAASDLQEIRALSIMLAGRKSSLNQAEAAQLATLLRAFQDHGAKIRRRLLTASRSNEKLAAVLKPLTTAFPKTCNDYVEWVNARILTPGAITVSPQRVHDEGTRVSAAFFAHYDNLLKATSFALDTRQARINDDQIMWIVGISIALIVVGTITLMVNTGITRQVNAIQETFSRLGSGELEARAAVRNRDELGELAARLNHMLDQLTVLVQTQEEREQTQRSIQRLLHDVSVLAEGDLTREAAVTADITGAIADAFNYMTAELRSVVSAVQRITTQVNHSAQTVQHTTSTLADNSTAQAQRIFEASERIQEIARSIQSVSRNSQSAAQVATQALESAKEGASSVRATIDGMTQIRNQVQTTAKRIKRLGESSQEIGEITQLIGDIADRTSILALNASIQAAMAGESGKGFAIVAEEVERLAERAGEATKRIEVLVSSIQNETTEAITSMEGTTQEVVAGSDLANNAGQRLSQIERVSVELAALINSISEATREQTAGSESVVRAMSQVSQFTSASADSAQRAADVVRGLAEQARQLQGSLQRFRLPEDQVQQASLTGQWAVFAGKQ